MADGGTTPQQVEDFITQWSKAEASERANAQPFLIGLAHILGVPEPSNSHADGCSFEFPVRIPTGPDTVTEGRIDLYYSNSRCFDPFPFPACDEAAKARIRALGEELDAHRKRALGSRRGNEAGTLTPGAPIQNAERKVSPPPSVGGYWSPSSASSTTNSMPP